jgi:hypothetical protein
VEQIKLGHYRAVCEVAASDIESKDKKWKIVRLYRGNQTLLKAVALRSMIGFVDVGDRGLLFSCRGRVPVFLRPRNMMPLLNRRTPSNPDGSMVPSGLSREETTNYYSMAQLENGALKISINEEATGFDVPQARIALPRIAALFQKRHRGRRLDSTKRPRRAMTTRYPLHRAVGPPD